MDAAVADSTPSIPEINSNKIEEIKKEKYIEEEEEEEKRR